MRIHIIGNSHTCIFANCAFNKQYPPEIPKQTIDGVEFNVYHIGPIIAYNFFEHHYNKVLDIINAHVNKDEDYIMIVVGEGDCRWHLPKQAQEQNRDVKDVTIECVHRFFRCYQDLKNQGYKCIAWGSHPGTTSGHCENMNNPVFGDCKSRNVITRLFAAEYKKLCDAAKIPFVSILEYLIDEDGLTKMSYFHDYCHLKSELILPLVINDFKRIGRSEGS